MTKQKFVRGVLALILALALCLSLPIAAFAAGGPTTAKIEHDVWTINFYVQDDQQYVTVTRLLYAYTTSLTGLTIDGETYDIEDAVSGTVLTDDYEKNLQATWKVNDYTGGTVVVQEETEGLTIMVDGVEKTYTREQLASCITEGNWTYTGDKTGDGVSYSGIATEYIMIPELLEFLHVDAITSISFRPIDWEGADGYIRTLTAEQAADAVLALKSYQSETEADVTADKADTMNAFRLIPNTAIGTGFDSVKWVNYISITTINTTTSPGGTVTIPGSPNTGKGGFVDVSEDSYYAEAVDWAVKQGVTTGIDDTHFSPDESCTRAQTVTFLWRSAGSPEPAAATNNPFMDVSADAYYYKAVLWAVENGITNGVSADAFAPEETVTRGQVVTFLNRAAGLPTGGETISFTDVISGAYYYNAVLWASEKGITNGVTTTTFCPDDSCTRAQIVTFLFRDYTNCAE